VPQEKVTAKPAAKSFAQASQQGQGKADKKPIEFDWQEFFLMGQPYGENPLIYLSV